MASCFPIMCGGRPQPYPLILIASYYQRTKRGQPESAEAVDVSKLAKYCVDAPSSVPGVAAQVTDRARRDAARMPRRAGHLRLALRLCKEIVESLYSGHTAEISTVSIFEDACLRTAACALACTPDSSPARASLAQPAVDLALCILARRLAPARPSDWAGITDTTVTEALAEPVLSVATGVGVSSSGGARDTSYAVLCLLVRALHPRRVAVAFMPLLPALFKHMRQAMAVDAAAGLSQPSQATLSCALLLRETSRRLACAGAGLYEGMAATAFGFLDAHAWRPASFVISLLQAMDGDAALERVPSLPFPALTRPAPAGLSSTTLASPVGAFLEAGGLGGTFAGPSLPSLLLQHLDILEHAFDSCVGDLSDVLSARTSPPSVLPAAFSALLAAPWDPTVYTPFHAPMYSTLHGVTGGMPEVPWWLAKVQVRGVGAAIQPSATTATTTLTGGGAGGVSPSAALIAAVELTCMRDGVVGAVAALLAAVSSSSVPTGAGADLVEELLSVLVDMAARGGQVGLHPPITAAYGRTRDAAHTAVERMHASVPASSQSRITCAVALAFGHLASLAWQGGGGEEEEGARPPPQLTRLHNTPLKSLRSSGAGLEHSHTTSFRLSRRMSVTVPGQSETTPAAPTLPGMHLARSAVLRLLACLLVRQVQPKHARVGERRFSASVSASVAAPEILAALEVALYDSDLQVASAAAHAWRVLLCGSGAGDLPEPCMPRLWSAVLHQLSTGRTEEAVCLTQGILGCTQSVACCLPALAVAHTAEAMQADAATLRSAIREKVGLGESAGGAEEDTLALLAHPSFRGVWEGLGYGSVPGWGSTVTAHEPPAPGEPTRRPILTAALQPQDRHGVWLDLRAHTVLAALQAERAEVAGRRGAGTDGAPPPLAWADCLHGVAAALTTPAPSSTRGGRPVDLLVHDPFLQDLQLNLQAYRVSSEGDLGASRRVGGVPGLVGVGVRSGGAHFRSAGTGVSKALGMEEDMTDDLALDAGLQLVDVSGESATGLGLSPDRARGGGGAGPGPRASTVSTVLVARGEEGGLLTDGKDGSWDSAAVSAVRVLWRPYRLSPFTDSQRGGGQDKQTAHAPSVSWLGIAQTA